MVPMVHLLESQERGCLLDGDANGRRVLRVGLWMVNLKSSECLCARCTAYESKSGTNYRLVRLVETYTLVLYKYNHV